MKCVRCGAEINSAEFRFCTNCGQNLYEHKVTETPKVKCIHCGTPVLSAEMKFCTNCGRNPYPIKVVEPISQPTNENRTINTTLPDVPKPEENQLSVSGFLIVVFALVAASIFFIVSFSGGMAGFVTFQIATFITSFAIIYCGVAKKIKPMIIE